MPWRKKRNTEHRDLLSNQTRTTSLLNFILAVSVAATAYTDWIIVENDSLGYLYVLPIALSGLVNPLYITVSLSILCAYLQDVFGPPDDPVHVRVIRGVISLTGYLIIGFLVTHIARQRSRLENRIRQERDDYERDLTLAAQVQRQVLSPPPVMPGIDLAAAMQTARLLGGDYYDFYPISNDTVDIVIADVSGKGAAASLLMPSLAVALRLRARELSGPAAIIKDLDTVLRQITSPSTFVTVFYARINPERRTLEYACGGHNPPLLVRPNTGEIILLDGSGPIVGILPNAQFKDSFFSLQTGDILTLYTDGITEQENEVPEQFSTDRLKQVILQNETDSASALVTHITDAVSTFAGPTEQEDDLTVVVAKIL
jgi:sigma-B regulation protein RsbU (phosphoserine phosphatase)